ncbi:MAG: hypothetical protein AB7N70_24995 [Dehalococcoidia bacterium]
MTDRQTTFLDTPSRSVPETVTLPDDPHAPVEVSLGDGVTLSMPRSTYDRNRDRVDWLVRWARKIFTPGGRQL